MKKFLSFFCGRGAVWLYLSILAMAVCPTMVSVLAALIKGALLGETEVFFTKMAGSLIGWLFLCLAFGRSSERGIYPQNSAASSAAAAVKRYFAHACDLYCHAVGCFPHRG